mgnify:FL=1
MRQLWKDWQLFAEETGEESAPDAGEQGAEDFETLIRGRYKEAFDARVQRILDGRLRNLRQENMRLRQDAELLLPEPYDSYYAHYLAAQMDAALGETDRYANEMQLANENQQEFAAWCRHTYLPRMATKWRY